MQIALGSIFRTSESYIPRYAAQVAALREAAPEHSFRLVLCEGDSLDNSYDVLKARFDGAVSKRAHGGPAFGSVNDPQRFRQMAWTWEGVFERLLPSDEIFIYVESDLIWDAATILKLIGHLEKPGVDVVSPMVWYQGRFYDNWGMRGPDGVCLSIYPPYHRSFLEPSYEGLYALSATGSCLVMKGEVARTAKWEPADMCIVGFSWNAVKCGYKIWMDPKARIHHPE